MYFCSGMVQYMDTDGSCELGVVREQQVKIMRIHIDPTFPLKASYSATELLGNPTNKDT